MAITKRQIVTGASVLYLAALTALAAYALHSAHAYSLPIPDILGGLALALPPLAGVSLSLLLSLNESLASKGHLQTSRIFQITVVAFIIFETVLATLAGTHLAPVESLSCGLRQKWEGLFKTKDEGRIRAIQDAFDCCGFRSMRDMAWPFQGNGRGADACVVRFERDRACEGPWRGEERKVAVMLLIVPVMVFLWKIAVVLAPSSGSAFLPSAIRLPGEDGHASGRPRGAIEYRGVEDAGEEDSIRAEVGRLNNESNLASQVEGGRTRGKNGLYAEHRHWRDPDDDA